MKYKFQLEGEDGKTYLANAEWVKNNLLGMKLITKEITEILDFTENLLKSLSRILAPTIIEFYKNEIYDLIKSREKHFRQYWIISQLSYYPLFYLEKFNAFDEMIKDGEILKGSPGWYRKNPDLIFDLRKEDS